MLRHTYPVSENLDYLPSNSRASIFLPLNLHAFYNILLGLLISPFGLFFMYYLSFNSICIFFWTFFSLRPPIRSKERNLSLDQIYRSLLQAEHRAPPATSDATTPPLCPTTVSWPHYPAAEQPPPGCATPPPCRRAVPSHHPRSTPPLSPPPSAAPTTSIGAPERHHPAATPRRKTGAPPPTLAHIFAKLLYSGLSGVTAVG